MWVPHQKTGKADWPYQVTKPCFYKLRKLTFQKPFLHCNRKGSHMVAGEDDTIIFFAGYSWNGMSVGFNTYKHPPRDVGARRPVPSDPPGRVATQLARQDRRRDGADSARRPHDGVAARLDQGWVVAGRIAGQSGEAQPVRGGA